MGSPVQPLLLDIVLVVGDLPSSADLPLALTHPVDGDDKRFEESNAGALEHVHGHERPAQQRRADGHVPRCRARKLVDIEAVVDGVHLRAVHRVPAVRVLLGNQVAGAAQEGADGRGAEGHDWFVFGLFCGCCCCFGWIRDR